MDYTYSLVFNSNSVQRSDGAFIPNDPGNTDWQQYQLWLSKGNAPTPVPIDIYKTTQKGTISSDCSRAITGGFQSNALGNTHSYPSDTTTQTNINVLASSGSNGSIWCADSSNTWSFATHTSAQSLQVQKDMVAHIQAQQTKYSQLIVQIDAANTVSQVQSVTW